MYCQKCKREIKEDQKLCIAEEDVTPITVQSGKSKSMEPILVVKPKFIPMIAVLSGGIIPAICLTGFGMLLYGNIFTNIATDFNLPSWFAYAFFGCLFFFITMSITLWIIMKVWEQTEYHFYPTRLDYYKGFLTIRKETVDYKDIIEVSMQDEAVQRMCGLGTIILSIPSMNDETGVEHSGIYMSYIERPDEAYKQIKYIVDRTQTDEKKAA